MSVWATLLGIRATGEAMTPDMANEAVRGIALLREELDRAEASMSGTILAPEDYEDAFQKLRSTLNYQMLYHSWSSTKVAITEEAIARVKICMRAARPTELVLSDEELDAFDEALAAMIEAVEALPETDGLAALLREQVAEMRRARIHYRVVGAVALRRAVNQLDGAILYAQQVGVSLAEEPPDSPLRRAVARASALSVAVKTILATTGIVIALGGAVTAAQSLAVAAAETQLYLLNPGTPPPDKP